MNELVAYTNKRIDDLEIPDSMISIVKWGISKFEKKRNEIIKEFYFNLMDGSVSDEKINYEKEYIKASEDDYFTLLNIAINDEEKEKVYIYTNIFKYIRNHQYLEKKEKIKLIRISKNLTFDALQVLIKINNFRLENHPTKKEESDFMKKMEKVYDYELKLLNRESLLDITSGYITSDLNAYQINEILFNQIICAFFNIEEHYIRD